MLLHEVVIHCMYIVEFVYSCVDGYLCYFQCLVIMNTGMNFFAHTCYTSLFV